ncbi:MAG: prepilin-type N-terminal cleavage/methylation domain-containing protein [Syntrophaceae bacterium]|nr:prepilin-type N-terminal cleavage/methylation domain-containing protein [Syntrophaceae bacterium]
MQIIKKKNRGVTLIELMIALVMSSVLIAALYEVFIRHQKTYVLQEQIVDTQQSVRIALNRMVSEIRMAGFGGVENVLSLAGGVNGFTQVITPGPKRITIVGGFKQIRRDNGEPILVSSVSGNQITLNYATNEFDRLAHRFISIGGLESSTVLKRDRRILTLSNPLKWNHPAGTPVFKIQAITYTTGLSGLRIILQRDENTGGGPQPVAENIEEIQFEYFDANGNTTADPPKIRMVRVTATARTDRPDPYLKIGDGYRRRQIASHIYIRNMGL